MGLDGHQQQVNNNAELAWTYEVYENSRSHSMGLKFDTRHVFPRVMKHLVEEALFTAHAPMAVLVVLERLCSRSPELSEEYKKLTKLDGA